jgi:hypothetical protein
MYQMKIEKKKKTGVRELCVVAVDNEAFLFFLLYMSPYLPLSAVGPGFIWYVTRGSYWSVSATLSVIP